MSGTVVVQVCWKKPWKRWSRRTSMDFFMWMKLEDDPSNDSISQNSIWAHPFHLPGYSAESLQDTPWRRGADPCGEVWVEFLYPHLPGSMLIYQKVIYITRFCHEVATHFFSVLNRNFWRTPSVASRLSKDQAGFLLETLVSTCSSTTRMGEGRRSAGLHFRTRIGTLGFWQSPQKGRINWWIYI